MGRGEGRARPRGAWGGEMGKEEAPCQGEQAREILLPGHGEPWEMRVKM